MGLDWEEDNKELFQICKFTPRAYASFFGMMLVVMTVSTQERVPFLTTFFHTQGIITVVSIVCQHNGPPKNKHWK